MSEVGGEVSKIERINRLFDSNPFDIPLPEWLSARVFYWVLLGVSVVLLSFFLDKIEKKTHIHIPGYVIYVVGMIIIVSLTLVAILVKRN